MEGEFLEKQEYKPFIWLRYIDDIFFIWTHGEDKLKTFLENLNQFHPNIKFTHESSTESIPFLDLRVKLSQGKLETDLHIKPTDRHQYLHYSSSHPGHTKRSIVYSQTLRVARVCSHETDFRKHTTEMKSWFLKRGYPNNVIEKEMKKVKFSKISSTRKGNAKVVPLVVTYHPGLKNINQIINKDLHLLYMDQEVKKVFTPKPMVSFRSARKLSSYLVRAKLYPLKRKVGSFECKGKRCQTCLNVNETDSIASSVTKEEYKINHCFDCNEKCLIYLLTCKVCLKQYVGQTVDEFRLRWNNYRSYNKKYQRLEPCMQEHLFEHFNEEEHHGFLEDVSITFIDKTDPSEPLKRENYWKNVLKTMAPLGLNIEGSV